MKKVKFFLLVAVLPLLFVFTSCSKDDDAPNVQGKWLYQSASFEFIMMGVDMSEMLTDYLGDIEMVGENQGIIFNADGTVSTYEVGSTEIYDDGKYTISGNQLTLIDKESEESMTFDVSVNGNLLKLIIPKSRLTTMIALEEDIDPSTMAMLNNANTKLSITISFLRQ